MGLGEPTSTSRKRTDSAMLKPATNTLLKLAKHELSNKPRKPSGKQRIKPVASSFRPAAFCTSNQSCRHQLNRSSMNETEKKRGLNPANNWWARKAAQIQNYASINDAKNFYETQKGVYGPSRFSLHPVRSTDGVLVRNKELVLARWAEYLQNLLNKVHITNPGFLHDPPTLPIIPRLDDPPSFDEVVKDSLKDNKKPVLTTSLLRSLILVAVLYTGGCIISYLTAGPLSVSLSNEKMPTLFLHTSKWVTEQNVETVVASPFSL